MKDPGHDFVRLGVILPARSVEPTRMRVRLLPKIEIKTRKELRLLLKWQKSHGKVFLSDLLSIDRIVWHPFFQTFF